MEINNTLEGINSRLDEAEDRIICLEDKVEAAKEKNILKNEESLRNLWDNIMGIPKENIISKALRTYLEKKMTQNIPNQVKKKRHRNHKKGPMRNKECNI